jgi:hypothetical protein
MRSVNRIKLLTTAGVLAIGFKANAQNLKVQGNTYLGSTTATPDARLVVIGDGTGSARIGGGTGCGTNYTGISQHPRWKENHIPPFSE